MTPPPSPPPGYTEGQPEDSQFPGVEIGMLAVFTGIGWLLQRKYSLSDLPVVRFLVLAAVAVVLTEILHEGCHVLAFASQGIESTVYWGELSVIPTEQFVQKRVLLIASIAPATLLNAGLIISYLIFAPGTLAIAAGLALAVNCSLSVLDLAVFVSQLDSSAETLYTFDIESETASEFWRFEPKVK